MSFDVTHIAIRYSELHELLLRIDHEFVFKAEKLRDGYLFLRSIGRRHQSGRFSVLFNTSGARESSLHDFCVVVCPTEAIANNLDPM